MRLLILTLLAISAFAQTTLYLSYGGAGSKKEITGCTNATPIVCSTPVPHGFAIGNRLYIFGVRGNIAANTPPGSYYVVGNAPSSSSFSLNNPDGSPVAGVGAYDGDGFVNLVRATTLVAHPRSLLDGPGGTITTRALDPDGTGPLKAPSAVAGFVPWDAISTYNSSILANPLSPASLAALSATEPMLPIAIAWYSNQSDTARRSAMLTWLNNIQTVMDRSPTEPFFGGCDETKVGCGIDDPEQDWRWFFRLGATESYGFMRSEMTTPERQAFAHKMLNGVYGESCVNRLTFGGSSRVTASGTTLTCTAGSCNFLSIASPTNRKIYIRTTAGVYGHWNKIASVTDNDHIVLTTAVPSSVSGESIVPWAYVKDWDTTMCGDMWWSSHHGYTPGYITQESYSKNVGTINASQTTFTVQNCGNFPLAAVARDYYVKVNSEWMKMTDCTAGTATVERGALFSTAATHATLQGVWGTATAQFGGANATAPNTIMNTWELDLDSPTHNLYWSKVYGTIKAACILADDDERARKMCQDGWNYFYNFVYPDAKDRWVGITQGGFSYGQPRWHTWMNEVAFVGKYSFSPAIDITDGEWLKAQGDYMPHMNLPWSASGSLMWGDSGSDPAVYSRFFRYLMIQYRLFDAASEVSRGMFWFRSIFNRWNAAMMKGPADYQIMAPAYLYIPANHTCPSAGCVDYRTTGNLTRFFTTDDYDFNQYPTSYNFVSSRSDWTAAPLSWLTMLAMGNPNDHSGTHAPASYKIAVNGQFIHANGPNTLDNGYGANRPEGLIVSANVTGTTNVGNGTVTGPADAIGDLALTGNYLLTCTAAASNGGTFSVTAPNGVVIGTATVGVQFVAPLYYGPLKFTINDGTIDWAVGDKKYAQVLGIDQRFSRNSFPDINKAGTVSYTHGIALPKQNKNNRGFYGNLVKVDKTKADTGYAYWRVNLDNSYQASAAVQRARRHFVNFTGTEAYTLVYDEMATTTAKPKERTTFCYTDDGVITYSKSGNTLNCTRSASRLQTLVLLPTDTSKITQSGGQVTNDYTGTYSSSSSSQRPDGSRRTWTLLYVASWPISVRVDDDGPGTGSTYTYRTWGLAGVDTGKQWYYNPGTATVTQCDNGTANTCPGAQEAAPPTNSYVSFKINTDRAVGWTINDGSTLSSEILLIHCAFAATTGNCPTTSTLTTISSNSRGVLVNHASRPKVAILDNDSVATNTSVSFTLSGLSAAAEMLVTGLSPGVWDVTKTGTGEIYSDVTVGTDGTYHIPASGGHGNGEYTLTQTGTTPVVDITTASPLPDGTVGTPYSESITVSGGTGPYTCSRIGGDLWPDDIILSSACALSGTPTTAQQKSVQVQGCDSTPSCTNKFLSITIQASGTALEWSSPSSFPDGQVGVAYTTQTLLGTGGTPPHTFVITSGALPGGLTQSTVTSTGDTISGTPTESGTFNTTFNLCDSADPQNCTPRTFTYQITATTPVNLVSPTSPVTCISGLECAAFWTVEAGTGTPPFLFTLTGAPPPGMALQLDGSVIGIPVITTATQDYPVRMRVDGFGGSFDVDESDIILRVTRNPISASASFTCDVGDVGMKCTLRYPGLDANLAGLVEVKVGDTVITSCTLPANIAFRECGVNGLTQSTAYNVDLTIGSEFSRLQEVTLATIGGTYNLTMSAYPPQSGMNQAKTYYGTDPENLSSNVITSCASGCTVTLPSLTRGTVYWWRREWLFNGVLVPTASPVNVIRIQ